MQKKEDIIVVGGYGHVGRTICEILEKKYTGKVFAAGRSLEKAEIFRQSTHGKIKPLQLDINKPLASDLLDRVKLVIMCLDQTDTNLVKACFRSGTHYVDVSANGLFLSKIEAYREEAEQHGACAILSVGLAPGITNLMALEAEKQMDQIEEIEIAIMLGLGDSHGKAAIEWTLNSLGEKFEVKQNDRQVEVKSFTDRKLYHFGDDLGSRHAYRFPFSDQQTLGRTLKASTISTRFCLDSVMITKILAKAKKTGAVRLLKIGWLNRSMVRAMEWLHLGSDRFIVKVEARGRNLEGKRLHAELLLQGTNQSIVTAKVTAAVSMLLYDSPFPGGVYHIEQITDLACIQKELGTTLSLEVQVREQNID
ncbi:saccharopine dehydrogenase NADP-binding domain-containing protein [Paenibacillus sp. FSL R10-2734]|uniref:saccharopine dehydrogenase family protein n=1 Tax=Paenibacillus sp. FSL R10-2734 TaxID=2954691 RepID=UPI0030DDC6B5